MFLFGGQGETGDLQNICKRGSKTVMKFLICKINLQKNKSDFNTFDEGTQKSSTAHRRAPTLSKDINSQFFMYPMNSDASLYNNLLTICYSS